MAMMDNCKKAEIFDDSGNLLCEAAVSCGPMGGLLLDVQIGRASCRERVYVLV